MRRRDAPQASPTRAPHSCSGSTSAPEHHRRGLATRLVRAAVDYVSETPEFDRLYLHTDARTPGALDFWLTFDEIVHDARLPGPGFQTVHLEIPLTRP
ncbi:GNAT family N-acetyltransferase [Nocardia gipuzkoensis]